MRDPIAGVWTHRWERSLAHRSPGFVPVFSVSRRSRHQPIGAALILFLKKHNNILSVYFSRLSSNCFPPYYIQPGRNILLLKIESSLKNQNKQKRLMSKLSCFARQRVIYDRGERSDTSMRVRFSPWFAAVQPSLDGRIRIEVYKNRPPQSAASIIIKKTLLSVYLPATNYAAYWR